MGKKRIRKNYTSKGNHSSVSRNTVTLTKRNVSECDKALAKVAAWKSGKNPWITVPNPVRTDRSRPFVKIRANTVYGDPKGRRNYGEEE